jgi:hypothetical protein
MEKGSKRCCYEYEYERNSNNLTDTQDTITQMNALVVKVANIDN